MGSRKSRTRQKNRRNRKNRANNRGPHFAERTSGYRGVVVELPVPVSLSGEADADRALFTPDVLAQLSDELRQPADAVLRAMELVEQGEFERANNELREIPRVSPYADWRMFVRGLTAWYEDDHQRATETWSRLEPNRRASRIAAVLSAATNQPGTPSPSDISEPINESAEAALPDQARLKMIELVQKLRDRRPALQQARQIAAVKHRDPETRLSAVQIAMLVELREKYFADDPQLVRQISDACVGLAFQQPDPELFSLLAKRIPGPPHDPLWNLATSQYLELFEGAEKPQARAIWQYLNVDLAIANTLTQDLRSAIASLIWQKQGEIILRDLGPFWDIDVRKIKDARKMFDRSADAWPKNRGAYDGLIACEEKPVEMRGNRQLKKADQDAFDRNVARVRERWIKALPDDVEPRLWLIDHYLQNDNATRAGELIDSLAQNRLDSPTLKMLPWKVRLFESLAITKKKRDINQAKNALAQAIAIWPTWLSRDLIGFLDAAMELRGGDTDAFAKKHQAAMDATGLPMLVCDVMTLGTLQMVNLPSAALKPFRAPVEQYVKLVESLSTNDLARLGSFFWDLQLAGLSYPALRMHGSKFGEELCYRLDEETPACNLPGLIDSCLWMSAAQFYSSDSWDPGFPRWVLTNRLKEPMLAAAVVRSFRPRRYGVRRLQNFMPELELVEQHARTDSSPLNRMVLEETAKTARQILDEVSSRDPYSWGFGRSSQSTGLPDLLDDEDEDWEDEDDEVDADYDDADVIEKFHPACNCPKCREARRQSEARRHQDGRSSRSMPGPFSRADDSAIEFDSDVSLEFATFAERMGQDGMERMMQMMEDAQATGRDNFEEIIAFVEKKGVSRDEFLAVFTMQKKRKRQRVEEPVMTPDEKREFRRKRKKLLDKKKQRR